MKIHNFKELQVWQKAMELVEVVYKLTLKFLKEERFGLAQQLQRCAISVPSNIAEGCGRVSTKDLQHFLSIAMGSCFEAETQIILSERFGYISPEDLCSFEVLNQAVQKMLFGFYRHLENK